MPPPAKKQKTPSGSAAAQMIKQYLDSTNRPWSVTNIVDSLAPTTGLNANGAKKALAELCENEQIDFKAYGKQTYYLSKQSQYTIPPEDEVRKEEAEINALKDQLDAMTEEQKALKQAVGAASARQTDAELQEELAALRVETASMEEKLRASKTGACKLTLKDVEALEGTARTRLSEWKARKRATREIVERIAEATGKRPVDIFKDMGCEEDPDYPDNLPAAKVCFDDTLFKQTSALVKPKPARGKAPSLYPCLPVCGLSHCPALRHRPAAAPRHESAVRIGQTESRQREGLNPSSDRALPADFESSVFGPCRSLCLPPPSQAEISCVPEDHAIGTIEMGSPLRDRRRHRVEREMDVRTRSRTRTHTTEREEKKCISLHSSYRPLLQRKYSTHHCIQHQRTEQVRSKHSHEELAELCRGPFHHDFHQLVQIGRPPRCRDESERLRAPCSTQGLFRFV